MAGDGEFLLQLQQPKVVAAGDFEPFAGQIGRDHHEIHATTSKIGDLPTVAARDY